MKKSMICLLLLCSPALLGMTMESTKEKLDTELRAAIAEPSVEKVGQALKKGAEVTLQKDGVTSVRHGISTKASRAIMELLFAEVKSFPLDSEGFNDVHACCRDGNYEALDLLLTMHPEVDVNALTCQRLDERVHRRLGNGTWVKQTALHLSLECTSHDETEYMEKVACAQRLLRSPKINPLIRDYKGELPQHYLYTELHNPTACCRLLPSLIAAGADLEAESRR